MKKLLVIGDKFTNLLTYDYVISYSQLVQNPSLITHETQLIYGQGIMHTCLDELLNLAPLPRWLQCFATDRTNLRNYPVKNCLLSNFRKNTETSFASWLSIDNNHDELQDHTTGIHLSGMLLLMAAEQFAEVVRNSYFPYSKTNISNGMEINFLRYTFPLETSITGKFETQSDATSLAIEFRQGSTLTAKASYQY